MSFSPPPAHSLEELRPSLNVPADVLMPEPEILTTAARITVSIQNLLLWFHREHMRNDSLQIV